MVFASLLALAKEEEIMSIRSPFWRSMRGLRVLPLLLSGWMVMAQSHAQAPTADPQAQAALSVLRAHFDAFNKGDVNGSSALLHDQVTYAAGRGCPTQRPCVGLAAARENFVAANIELKMRVTLGQSAERFGENFSTSVEVTWPAITSTVPGVQRLVGLDMFRVADGKIILKHFLPDMMDEQTGLFFRTMAERSRQQQPK